MAKKYTLESIAYQLDSLKRIVYFDNYEQVYINLNQASMVTFTELDISSLVSARAEVGIFQIILAPDATSYWNGFLSSDGVVGSTTYGLGVYSYVNSRANINMGFCKLSSSRSVYYRFNKVTGGGNANAFIWLHGYIEPT